MNDNEVFRGKRPSLVPVEQKDEVFWKEQEIVSETPEIKLHRFLLYLAVYVELSLYNI